MKPATFMFAYNNQDTITPGQMKFGMANQTFLCTES